MADIRSRYIEFKRRMYINLQYFLSCTYIHLNCRVPDYGTEMICQPMHGVGGGNTGGRGCTLPWGPTSMRPRCLQILRPCTDASFVNWGEKYTPIVILHASMRRGEDEERFYFAFLYLN